MTNTEIKKALYKEKPIAILTNIDNDNNLTYEAILNNSFKVIFYIPSNETVDVDGKKLFEQNMDAKLLNRWIVN